MSRVDLFQDSWMHFQGDPFAVEMLQAIRGVRVLKMSPAAQLRFPGTPLMPNEVAKGASLAGSQQGKLCKAKT